MTVNHVLHQVISYPLFLILVGFQHTKGQTERTLATLPLPASHHPSRFILLSGRALALEDTQRM